MLLGHATFSKCEVTLKQRFATKIMIVVGNLTNRYKEIFYRNPLFVGMKLPEVKSVKPFEHKMPNKCSKEILDVMKVNVLYIFIHECRYMSIYMP